MAIYYIDAINGDDSNTGLSPEQALASYRQKILQPGDTVLFKRGSFMRTRLDNVSGVEGKPITYGAYGEGELPVFCGSLDLTKEELWVEEEKNIWACKPEVNEETANIILNGNEEFGTFRWTKEELSQQGDFYDNCFGFRAEKKELPPEHRLYIYSEKNPALFYSSIEWATYGDKFIMANNGSNMVFENLKFLNCGVHAIAGDRASRNIVVRGCVFKNVGGGVWGYNRRIRFGNAFECWNVAENIEITNCVFDNIYDSGVTHQGNKDCEPCKNFNCHHNIFIKCGMAAYEQRDMLPKNSSFCDNICIDAGEGFSGLGEVMPRNSEIWPQPMGHHIFLWRIENPTDDGKLEIKNNVFCNAAYGGALYSIISPEAEAQIELSGNTYYTKNDKLFSRWNGIDYTNFGEYKSCEADCKFENTDISDILNKIRRE